MTLSYLLLIPLAFIWFYVLFSILETEFKDKEKKVLWLFLIIFVPLLSVFYLFIKKDLVKHVT